IPNGVPRCTDAGQTSRQVAREQLFPGERRCVVLAAARLEAQKALHLLIAAAAQLDDVLVVIAGEGPLRPELEAQTAASNVTDRVRFLGWRDDVPALLRAADVFVLPSLHEGLPLSVLEAARAGTPVIASRIGGTDEVITD